MPRRPRPALRGKSGKEKSGASVATSPKAQTPHPKAVSQRKLKPVDSDPGSSEEEWDDEEEPSLNSDEEDNGSDEGSLGNSGEDGEESDVDVDALRVAQWVDEDELELEMPSGDAPPGKGVNAEDIVRVMYVSPKPGFMIYFALSRKPYKIVRKSPTPVGDCP